MSLKEINRRRVERRIDKTAMKARLTAGALKRTIGENAAKRYLERNGYDDHAIREMLQSPAERRNARRRSDPRPARFQTARHSGTSSAANDAFDPLTAQDIRLLFRLRWATDSGTADVRVSDYPARFAHFGLMELGKHGAHITERGRAALLQWSRAKALLAISQGQGLPVYDDSVQVWLENNRFIANADDSLIATSRGLEWLALHKKSLPELDGNQS